MHEQDKDQSIQMEIQPPADAVAKPLSLEIDKSLEHAPKEAHDAIRQMAQVIEKQSGLFYWEKFPIVLPAPSLPPTQSAITFANLFQIPPHDELEEVARDINGKLKHLSESQLEELREGGQFSVPSQKFPNQIHVWRVANFLQGGRAGVRKSLNETITSCLRMLIIYMPDLFVGELSFSLANSFTQLYYVVRDIPGLAFGLIEKIPRYSDVYGNLGSELHARRKKYVMEQVEEVGQHIWKTKDGTLLDFRLYDPTIKGKALDILHRIDNRIEQEWIKDEVLVKESIARQLIQEGIPSKDIPQLVHDRATREKQERVYKAILEDKSLQALDPAVPKRVVDYMKAVSIVSDCGRQFLEEAALNEKKIEESIRAKHTVKSRVSEWTQRQKHKRVKEIFKENVLEICDRAVNKLRESGHIQEATLLALNVKFRREQEASLRQKLAGERVPRRVFPWSYWIWNPKNWIIEKKVKKVRNEEKFYYTVQKEVTSMVTTNYPGWRFLNMWHATATAFKNGLYILLPVNLWASPVGLRALFAVEPFYPGTVVNESTGKLEVDNSMKVETLASRLKAIWDDVKRSRQKFEDSPDNGFLGKGITRVFNSAYNYIIKGALGTLLVSTMQPTLTILNVVISLFLFGTSFIWAPVSAVARYLFNILFYDSVSGRQEYFPLFAVVLKFLIGVCVQSVGSVVLALLQPIFASILLLLSYTTNGIAYAHDSSMFHILLKRYARIPLSDGFLIKRIKGPGLSSSHFFRISTDMALVALQALMERKQVLAYKKAILKWIEQPGVLLTKYYQSTFGPLAAQLNTFHPLASKLTKRTASLTQELDRTANNYIRHLPLTGNVPRGTRIQQDAETLEETLRQGSVIVEEFYTQKIFPKMTKNEQYSFWHSYELAHNNFLGLTRALFSELFSATFLIPAEENDSLFSITVEDITVSNYAKMLVKAKPRDPMDKYQTSFISQNVLSLAERVKFYPASTALREAPVQHLVAYEGVLPTGEDEIHLEEIYLKNSTLKLTSIQVTIPPGSHLGICIHIKGTKPPDFTLKAARLLFEGEELWAAAGTMVNSTLLKTFRYTLYPVMLTPTYMNPNDVVQGITAIDTKVTIGTGQESMIKFNYKKLGDIVKAGDPSFRLIIEYGNIECGWMTEGELISIDTKASVLLKAVEGEVNLLKMD